MLDGFVVFDAGIRKPWRRSRRATRTAASFCTRSRRRRARRFFALPGRVRLLAPSGRDAVHSGSVLALRRVSRHVALGHVSPGQKSLQPRAERAFPLPTLFVQTVGPGSRTQKRFKREQPALFAELCSLLGSAYPGPAEQRRASSLARARFRNAFRRIRRGSQLPRASSIGRRSRPDCRFVSAALRTARRGTEPCDGHTHACGPSRGFARSSALQRNALSSTVAMYSPSSPRIIAVRRGSGAGTPRRAVPWSVSTSCCRGTRGPFRRTHRGSNRRRPLLLRLAP